MNENLAIKKETRRTCHVLRLAGSVSAKNILDLRAAFDEALKNNCRKMAIDLSSVDFLDSMGVGILINFNKRLAKDHGQLVLINPSDVVTEIFDIADTAKYLKVRKASATELDAVFD